MNLFLSYALFAICIGRIIPGNGLESVWIISATSVWLLNLLATPFFTPPRDAIATALGASIALLSMDIPFNDALPALAALRWTSVALCFFVICIATGALILFQRDERNALGRQLYDLTNHLGRGEFVFSLPAILSVAAIQIDRPLTVLGLTLAWLLLFVARPVDSIYRVLKSGKKLKDEYSSKPTVGAIHRVDHPNIIRVRLLKPSDWNRNSLYVSHLPNGTQNYVLALSSQLQGEEVIGTGLLVGRPLTDPYTMPVGSVVLEKDDGKKRELLNQLSGKPEGLIAGHVIERSSISIMRFELSPEIQIAKGDVVYVKISGKDVFYQVLDGMTNEEVLDANPRGMQIAEAAQLGVYDPKSGFQKFEWLPEMNCCVFQASDRKFEKLELVESEFSIGVVPSTDVDIGVDINDIVEHHAAVLGTTGTGKTELVLKIIREAHARGVKVICVDFTGDYKQRLDDLKPVFPSPSSKEAQDFEDALFAVATGSFGAKEERRELDKFIKAFQPTVEKQITDYLQDKENNLAILELSDITNTRATLRVTELYLSAAMRWASKNRKLHKILIVLEEAHTIVPETAGAGFDSDTQWTVGRIGQIALQGRKYGVGLLLVSQRTALVSKTILSQCNTFFTHALIDQTSLNFLNSVYSTQHAALVPNLAKLQLLAAGKAVKSERPIVVQRPYDKAIEEAVAKLK